MLLLIDGYNVIFAGLADNDKVSLSDKINTNSPSYLASARDNLISLLKAYNQKRNYEIVVVFDGNNSDGYYVRQKEAGIDIIFSKHKSTADDLIISIVSSYADDRLVYKNKSLMSHLQVVTSDNALAHALSKYRIKITPVDEFIEELPKTTLDNTDRDNSCRQQENESSGGEPIEKFVGLLPSEVDGWLKVLEKDEEE